jgi:hypothetical protein
MHEHGKFGTLRGPQQGDRTMTRVALLLTATTLAISPLSFASSLPTKATPTTTTAAISNGALLEDLQATARLDEVRRQRDSYEASQFVTKAVKEVRAGRDDAAEALFAKAAQLDGSNEHAAQGLRETRERLGLLTTPSSLIDRAGKERRVQQQEAQYRFEAAIADAQQGINSGKPDGFRAARLAILRAKQIRSQSASAFSQDELKELDGRLRDHDLQSKLAVQKREDAEREADRAELRRRIKEARVHDITLD